jgi:hypothetical protein
LRGIWRGIVWSVCKEPHGTLGTILKFMKEYFEAFSKESMEYFEAF